jgi:hypothetical protein
MKLVMLRCYISPVRKEPPKLYSGCLRLLFGMRPALERGFVPTPHRYVQINCFTTLRLMNAYQSDSGLVGVKIVPNGL